MAIFVNFQNLVIFRPLGAIGPLSEQMEELGVVLAYKEKDGATLLVETCGRKRR